ISKRHTRRLIQNETNIDVAGCSKFNILKPSLSTNNSFNKDYDLHLHNENINESIENIASFHQITEVTTFENDSYEQCLHNNNFQRSINNYDDNDINNKGNYEDDDDDDDINNEDNDHDCHNSALKIINKPDNNADDKNFQNAITIWAIILYSPYNINHNACNICYVQLLMYEWIV
ncbi:hypothetical protein ALC60_00348, partial [Trachymyrmex zeteki]